MGRLLHRLRSDDAGFGLVEAVVALLIAGIVFSALASTLVGAVQASLYSRQNQQATDFMTRELEELRAMGYGALAHTAGTVDADPRLVSCVAGRCLEVDGVLEPVVTVPSNGLASISETVAATDSNGTAFTVSRYITAAPGQPVQNVRRATVVVAWVNGGVERTRETSTLIALTQRGLPLPVFRLELPVATSTVNPGGQLAFTLTLTNQGAPDRWDLTHDGGAGWAFYADTDGDGGFDGSVDASLADTTSNGVPDTGRVDPSTTFRFFLVRPTSAGEASSIQGVTVTARSAGQPAATKAVTGTAVVTIAVIAPSPSPAPSPGPSPEPTCAATAAPPSPSGSGGYSALQYTLQHGGVGDSTLQSQMYLSTSAADEPALAHYSTDVDAAATGRVLQAFPGMGTATAAAILGSTDATQYADWAVQLGSKSWVDGDAVLRLWAARHSVGTSAVSVRAIIYEATSSGAGLSRTPLATADVSLGTLDCAGFQELYIELPPMPAEQVEKNAWLGVRVVTDSDPVRLAYDVPSQFPSSLTVRTK